MKEVIILAGGLGTRLKSVVSHVPKCLAPINGSPFLYHTLKYLENQGINRFIFSLGYKSDMIINYIENNFSHLNWKFVVEKEALNTGGAIKLASQFCQTGDVFILNGDTMFNVDLDNLYKSHIETNASCSIALKPMNNFSRYGIVQVDGQSRVILFKEKQKYNFGLINGGIYCLKIKDFLTVMAQNIFSFEKVYLEGYYKTQNIYGFTYEDFFIDIGIPEDFLLAQNLINY